MMRGRGVMLVTLLAFCVGVADSAVAATLCRSKKGKVSFRETECKPKEVAIDLGAIGAVGPIGPEGPQGPAGVAGADGADGADGSALGYARIIGTAGGVTVDAARSLNVTNANVTRGFTGIYCFNGLPFTPKIVVASPQMEVGFPQVIVGTSTVPDGGDFASCAGDEQARIEVLNRASGAFTDATVYVVFE